MRNLIPFIYFIILMLLPILFDRMGVARLIAIFTYAYIMSIFAISFSLLLGYLGLLCFGQALFFGLGAYVTAYQLLWLGIPYPLALIVSAITGSLMGLAVAFINRKVFRGIPFTFITLSVLLIFYFLYRRRELRAISGGEQGLMIPLPEVFRSEMLSLVLILIFVIMLIDAIYVLKRRREVYGNIPTKEKKSVFREILLLCLVCIVYLLAVAVLTFYIALKPGPFRASINMYIISLTVLCVIYILLRKLLNTPLALAWIAIRDNEVRAKTMGYNSFMLKTVALVISGAIASVAGGLYVLYSQNINPDSAFSPLISIQALIYSIIGGIYMIEGPIVGAILVTFIERYLAEYFGGWNMVFVGVMFIIVVFFLAKGVSYYLWVVQNRIFPKLPLIIRGKIGYLIHFKSIKSFGKYRHMLHRNHRAH